MNPQIDIATEEATGHSLFGASKAHRLLPCPGSLLAEVGEPDTAGFEAAEGTVAHGIAEMLAPLAVWHGVLTSSDTARFVGTTKTLRLGSGEHKIDISSDMVEYVREYVQWCVDLPGDHLFEQRVDYSCLTPIPNQGGTADHIALSPGHLTITDFKFGTGVQVFAERNPQAMLYALGAVFAWDWLYSIKKITIRICQPRLGHFDVWETNYDDLMAFADYAKSRFALAWDADAVRTPSEKACQFCKVRAKCGALVAALDRLADATFVDESFTPAQIVASVEDMDSGLFPSASLRKAGELTTAELGAVLRYRKLFESFFGNAFTELQRRITMLHEDPPDGWMMAAGQVSRSFAAGAAPEIEKLLLGAGLDRSDMYVPETLKSPAQMESVVVGKLKRTKRDAVALLQGLVITRPGNPVLAPRKPGKQEAPDLASATFVDET